MAEFKTDVVYVSSGDFFYYISAVSVTRRTYTIV